VQLTGNAVAKGGAQVNLPGQRRQCHVPRAQFLHRRQHIKRSAQLLQLTRVDAQRSRFGHKAFQIASQPDVIGECITQFLIGQQRLHHTEAFVNRRFVFQWQCQPAFQQARTHRRHGAVNHINHRARIVVGRAKQLQIAHRKTIQPHVAFFLNARNSRNVLHPIVLRFGEVMQGRTGCNHTRTERINAKSF
jgi:hypothetical protein